MRLHFCFVLNWHPSTSHAKGLSLDFDAAVDDDDDAAVGDGGLVVGDMLLGSSVAVFT